MNHRALLMSALIGVAAPVALAEETRELGAHLHGSGTMNIAIEGRSVAIEFDAPGADIVGFEYAAESAEDRAKVDAAIADLAKPLDLFVLPAAARCSVTAANVALITEGEEHGEDEHHSEEHAEEAGEEGHTEFHAEYRLSCAAPEAFDRIEFVYFERFPAAEELDVQMISDKGAQAFEVERDAPMLDLRGLI